jgi:formylglycine-generating enzyme required for sulfatase activity
MSRDRRNKQKQSSETTPPNSSEVLEVQEKARSPLGRLALLGFIAFASVFLLTLSSKRNVSKTEDIVQTQSAKSLGANDESIQKNSSKSVATAQNSNTSPEITASRKASTEDMVWIPPTEFLMGSNGSNALRNEQPAHAVKLDGFWMDIHEVTNAQFQKFVDATGYITTAELKPDWEEMKKTVPPGTPRPPDEVMVPGSLVFIAPPGPVPTDDVSQWWAWTPGASWKHPEGPGTSTSGRENHPVVHVSWFDANAYSQWAGKRLPTEAEWECASRGKLNGKRFTWGDEPPKEDSRLANIWQGTFPNKNDKLDGWDRTSPVKTYPANGYGLYDMSGNVWEWCSDWYRADAYLQRAEQTSIVNPRGPKDSWDPAEPHAAKRVIRGGSFLCHITYCESYRTAARRGNTPDTGMSHLGFRCALSEQKSP